MNMSARQSAVQQAQANIQNQLLTGIEKEFFRNLTIITSDQGDILTAINTTIGQVGLCITIEVDGGKVPVAGDSQAWRTLISIYEMPVVNRGENGTGKTADVVLDAVIRATANGGYFVSEDAEQITMPGFAKWIIAGTTNIQIATTPPSCKQTEREETP